MKLPTFPCRTFLLGSSCQPAQRLRSTRFSRRGPTSPGLARAAGHGFPPRTTPSDALPKTRPLPTSCLPTMPAPPIRLGIDLLACRGRPASVRLPPVSTGSCCCASPASKRTIQYPPTPISRMATLDVGLAPCMATVHLRLRPLMPLDVSRSPASSKCLAVSVRSQLLSLPDGVLLARPQPPSLKAARRRPEDIAATP